MARLLSGKRMQDVGGGGIGGWRAARVEVSKGGAREQKTSGHIVKTKKKLANQADKQEDMPSHRKVIKSSTSSTSHGTSQASKTPYKQPRKQYVVAPVIKGSWAEAERSSYVLEENLSGLLSQLGSLSAVAAVKDGKIKE